jgi:histidyl-tRNA synthetase
VKKYLDTLEIPYVLDPYIVRGLDYYTRTVFEVVHKSLGAQNAIGAGGRYDNLVASLGGPELGACGFALGVERTLMAAAKKAEAPGRPPLDVYIAGLGEEAEVRAFKILDELRDEGIACDMDYEAKSLKAKMRTADKLAVRFVSIIGEDELKKNAAVLRDMAAKEQSEVGLDRLVQEIKKRMG